MKESRHILLILFTLLFLVGISNEVIRHIDSVFIESSIDTDTENEEVEFDKFEKEIKNISQSCTLFIKDYEVFYPHQYQYLDAINRDENAFDIIPPEYFS